MKPPVIAFFNNKGGVGKTSLVYHLTWMMAEKGLVVVAADFDPQANLTANFLAEEDLERLWPAEKTLTSPGKTVYGSLAPLVRGVGDISEPPIVDVADRISLLPGDLTLSKFEDELSSQWPACLDGSERAFRVTSAFWRLIEEGADLSGADVILVDVGPNLGAINRSALIAAEHIVIPLAPDLFSVQGLQNLGPALRRWRTEWLARLERNPNPTLELPTGQMRPSGYVLMGHGVRLGRPVKAYQRWMARIPEVYRTAVLDIDEPAPVVSDDPYCLGQLKHYRSLMPLSYEARKPVFALKPADGAFGGHQTAVTEARGDFSRLADRILQEVGLATGDRS
ncbi:ParA family protein [Natronosporangium hydrolyticum]|uniref:ParA family protein n=1 Tax=Natronosporangium hydrolyticum TaxID=2811111 RepID=A0A895YPR6_9ACTN|nr:AAA family ATPase [Natronosporangium hydrolyticum]QSB16726.1 ParA family protein [Natronosporangium hydrolyticum]